MSSADKTPKHWTVQDDEDGAVVHDSLLGRGGFGEVHKMFDNTTNKAFARKIIRVLGAISEEDYQNETSAVELLCQSQHPNIVQVLKYGQFKEDSVVHYIDMELCSLSLEDYLKGKTVPGLQAWESICSEKGAEIAGLEILSHILCGLLFIHCSEKAHRDLCPSNVLWKDGYWKIADFGLTSDATSNRLISTSAARGKPCYRPPELLRDMGSGFNHKSDMWSFGCITFELFTGKKAFEGDFEVFDYARANKTPRVIVKELSQSQKRFVQEFFQINPEDRPSCRTTLKSLVDYSDANAPKHPVTTSGARSQKRKRLPPTSGTSLEFPVFAETLSWAFLNNHGRLLVELLLELQVPADLLYQTYIASHEVDRAKEAILSLLREPDLLKPLLWPASTSPSIYNVQDHFIRAASHEQFGLAHLILKGIGNLKLNDLPDAEWLQQSAGGNAGNGPLDRMVGVLRQLEFILSPDRHYGTIERLCLLFKSAANCDPSFEILLAVSSILPAEFVTLRTADCAVIQYPTRKGLNWRQVDIFDVSLRPRLMRFSPDGNSLHIAGSIYSDDGIDQRPATRTQVFHLPNFVYSVEESCDGLSIVNPFNLIDMHICRDVSYFITTPAAKSSQVFIRHPHSNRFEILTLQADSFPVDCLGAKVSHSGDLIAYATMKSDSYQIRVMDLKSHQLRHEWSFPYAARTRRFCFRLKFSPGDKYLCAHYDNIWFAFYDLQLGVCVNTHLKVDSLEPIFIGTQYCHLKYEFLPSKPGYLVYNYAASTVRNELKLLHFPTSSVRTVIKNLSLHDFTFSPDGSVMATTSGALDCRVQLWSTLDWQLQSTILIRSFKPFNQNIKFHPLAERKIFAIATGDRKIRLFQYIEEEEGSKRPLTIAQMLIDN